VPPSGRNDPALFIFLFALLRAGRFVLLRIGAAGGQVEPAV
jgi:hypothetical protein